MKPIENDKTTSTIVLATPDGETTGTVTLPTTILHDDEARLLRQYRDWCETRRIHRSFYCPHCRVADPMTEGRTIASEMQSFITDAQILIACDHRRLFYQGLSHYQPFRLQTDEAMPPGFILYNGPVKLALNQMERELIRAVKDIRRKYDFQEANACQDCFEHGDYDWRMRGGVDDRNGRISWYCAHRVFMGQPSIC